MNLEKVIFGFFVLLAATVNFGFVVGDLGDPAMHNIWELYAAIVVNVVALVLKFGDRTQIGATHLATSLVAVLQLLAAASLYIYYTSSHTETISGGEISSVVSLACGAALANLVSLVLLVAETVSFRRR
ncbi:DUF6394 family protein [Arsenicicoccus sp. oral taxon 190]|uniref:DUF6394 family protein n=1 Tax=Arsenicicoccus sp. oral taxon 190 TaxID=1658671 RepID=UPI000679FF9F|nr:DUF6394 family protein [Arsenicicoccus sp. oral taxon 190]AKT51016.1 hypothetical protein ADJ73_06265 [Arsenicicoccus sp. oral taxon 190]